MLTQLSPVPDQSGAVHVRAQYLSRWPGCLRNDRHGQEREFMCRNAAPKQARTRSGARRPS